MLYLGETIDLGEHKLIEIKTDEEILFIHGNPSQFNFEIEAPSELNGKFCFIKPLCVNRVFISDSKKNGCKIKDKTVFDITIHKDKSNDKESVVEKDTIVAYLCYIVKDISLDIPQTDVETDEITITLNNPDLYIFDNFQKIVSPNGNIDYIIKLAKKS